MHVWEAIQSKRAIRQFRDEPLQPDHIERILNAGRRSQSSKNSQPWHFIAVEDKARLAQIAELGAGMGHVAGAALCIVIVVPIENERTLWHFFDSGQSAAYMQLGSHRNRRRLLPRYNLPTRRRARSARHTLGSSVATCDFLWLSRRFRHCASTAQSGRPPPV